MKSEEAGMRDERDSCGERIESHHKSTVQLHTHTKNKPGSL